MLVLTYIKKFYKIKSVKNIQKLKIVFSQMKGCVNMEENRKEKNNSKSKNKYNNFRNSKKTNRRK